MNIYLFFMHSLISPSRAEGAKVLSRARLSSLQCLSYSLDVRDHIALVFLAGPL